MKKFIAGFVGIAMAASMVGSIGTAGAASYMFNADLTIGSQGPDVVALQTILESAGHLVIPAGVAKGYFGALTQQAVAKWQASVGITPAAGYFGPKSRAYINAQGGPVVGGTPGCPAGAAFNYMTGAPCTGGTSSPTPTSTGGLSGGEASLESYEIEGEESSGAEGESDVEIATASFDVEDGDARIERVEVDFQAESTSDSVRPWDYFDSVSILVNGEVADEMDVDSRADWDEDDADSDHDASSADWYRLTFTGLNEVVNEGDTAEITIAANIAGNIDGTDLDTQEFTVLIPDEGIRATDGEGIQQYTGDSDEVVSDFGFDEEESGDLDIETNSDDPDVMTLISDEDNESEAYTVFVFDMENNDSVDTLVTDITINVATSSGDAITDILDEATLVVNGDEYDGDINADGTIDFDDIDVEIAGDETATFELVIVLKEDAPDSTLDFTVNAAGVEAEGVESGDDATDSGSVSSETHTVSAAGIVVEGTGKTADTNDDGDVGTFTIEFTVEALEEDVYIYNGAADAAFASTTGMFYNIYRSGTLMTATGTDSAVVQSSADAAGLGNAWFVVEAGETEDFTLTVTLAPNDSTALYSVELDSIRFDDAADTTVGDTVYELPNDAEFETAPISIE